jgi:arylsulfatase A-like enzyme
MSTSMARMRLDAPARPTEGGRILLFGLLLVACGGAGEAPEGLPPNLVLVTLDTTRADHLGLFGYHRETTPFMDSLGEESLVFERCVVPMATTLPTHTSILTGTWPLEHGVLANSSQGGRRFRTAPGLRSFAEFAQDYGYATGGFVSATPLKRDSGIAAGFDVFEQPERETSDGEVTTRRALAWLRGIGEGQPYFLWLHYFDAHWPPNAPASYRGLFEADEVQARWMSQREVAPTALRPLVGKEERTSETIDRYDEDLRYQDDQLKGLVDALRRRGDWQRTSMLVIADHGDGHGQHGHLAHGGTWGEQLHAPLLMLVPGVKPRRVEGLASAADALPTMLGLLELEGFEGFLDQCSGRDLFAPDSVLGPVLSQDTARGARKRDYRWCLTGERWKYFRIELRDGGVDEELYDLEFDPHELRDVHREEPEIVERMRNTLARQVQEQTERGRTLRQGAASTQPAAPGLTSELRSLGYTGEDQDDEEEQRNGDGQ